MGKEDKTNNLGVFKNVVNNLHEQIVVLTDFSIEILKIALKVHLLGKSILCWQFTSQIDDNLQGLKGLNNRK